jgi:hypothetical protein
LALFPLGHFLSSREKRCLHVRREAVRDVATRPP